MSTGKKLISIILAACLLASAAACGGSTGINSNGSSNSGVSSGNLAENYKDAHILKLNKTGATLDGAELEVFDYTWHCDPSEAHSEVKNAPAEYYTGTKPETTAAAYIDHELYYYPKLDESAFKLINYDGEREWAYYYNDGVNNDYIFATLPRLGNSLPSQMMHTEEEALSNQVLHITKPGTYIVEGDWMGQIRVDLGDEDETFTDESAKIVMILNGVNIECTVAPGVIFGNVYECENDWEEKDASHDVDTSDAGVTVIIADGSENTVSGCNVYRMLKTKYKDESSTSEIKLQKKMRKTDAAFYSYVTMNIEGQAQNTGKLTVTSSFEGLDSELHLSFKGGNITVNSQDDGINVNEDHVSVVAFYGGSVTINAALGAEGDGVDSNGFIVVDGGNISVNGVRTPDSALDSEDGIYYQSGKIVIDGEEQTYAPGSTFRETGRGFGGNGGFPGGKGDRDFPGGNRGEFPDRNKIDRDFPDKNKGDRNFPENKGELPGGNDGPGRDLSAPEGSTPGQL